LETLRPLCEEEKYFLQDLGKKVVGKAGQPLAKPLIFQRIGIAVMQPAFSGPKASFSADFKLC
jgi:hypothetical protein